MPSKMSLFNKELLLQISRSTGWISIVYFIGLLFLLPIRILLTYSDEEYMRVMQKPENLFHFNFEFQIGLTVIIPVILAVFLFRFLHVKQATDLIHSLPLKRDKIFYHYLLAGMVFLIIPIVLITLILHVMNAVFDLHLIYSVSDIYYWAGTTLVILLLLYAAAVWIATLTGISAVQAVLAYIFLLFPAGFMLLLFYNLKILLFGFPSEYFLSKQIERLSPITFAARLNEKQFHWSDAGIFMGLSVILYGLALLFYRKRNLETASEAIAFPKLRCVFKYGAAFCTMLLGGSYFNQVSNSSFGWTLFGYVLGGAAGYFLAEMVLQKSWRVFTRVKGLLVFLAIIALLAIGTQTLGIYENRIPDQEEIMNVEFTDSPSNYFMGDSWESTYAKPAPLKNSKTVLNIIKLHEQILKDKHINQSKKPTDGNFFFKYKLKNGHSVIREYRVNMKLYEDLYQPIYESREYKLANNQLFKVDESNIKTINILPHGPSGKSVSLKDPNDIKEAIALLKQDILEETYEEHHYYQYRGSNFELNLGTDRFISIEMSPNYRKIMEWLKQKNLADQALVTADDISSILVTKGDYADKDYDLVKKEVEESGNVLKITDKDQIQEALNQAGTGNDQEYTAVFCYNSGQYYDVWSFDEAHVPDFIKEHFK
ncbi:DUF6449 domain-containing protein [Bacillus sp. JJ1764]|uniref:DUF6449 domain-containing protein n=1 Tax=Bacillus sp. JJ1764 TaxID=3122964 RepID=UPI002FFDA8F7